MNRGRCSRGGATLTEVMLFMVIGLMMLMLIIHLTAGENRLDRWAEARLDAIARLSAALENMRRDASTAGQRAPEVEGVRWGVKRDQESVEYRWASPGQNLVRAGAQSRNLGPLATFEVAEQPGVVTVRMSAGGVSASGVTSVSANLYAREPGVKAAYPEWVPDATESR